MKTKNSADMVVTLVSDREMSFTRTFDAPRDLIWKVMTDPTLIPQWWGPASNPVRVETMDVCVGGKWRYIVTTEDGEIGFRGEYREIEAPEHIVQTFEFEPMAGHISVETLVLEDHGNKTVVRGNSVYPTAEDAAAVVNSGMEGGMRETYDRLEELLIAELQKQA
jgi:uncharacterized protein YndB with AHSA1/START domain